MKTYNLSEITDSTLLYDKDPPKFMNYIILIIFGLIIGFIVWSTSSIKTFIVKGQGIITTEKKSNIMTKVSAEIKEVYIEEGKAVKEGELLLVFNPSEHRYQLQLVDGQLSILNKRIELLKRAENDATNGTNTFNKNSSEEIEFYNKLINSYTKLEEHNIDEELLKKQGYSDEEIKQYKKQVKIKKDQIYYETILEFTNERNQLEIEKEKLEAQKKSLTNSKEEYKLYASSNGKVHLNTQIKKGMVLQAGSLVGTISATSKDIIVEALIPSSDRPRIHEQDEVSLAIGGLNQAEYGTLNGKIVTIDEDATIDAEKGAVFFKVKIKPEKTYLKDRKGEKINLVLGMVAETRVKYEKITYMKYFMEQIGIKFS